MSGAAGGAGAGGAGAAGSAGGGGSNAPATGAGAQDGGDGGDDAGAGPQRRAAPRIGIAGGAEHTQVPGAKEAVPPKKREPVIEHKPQPGAKPPAPPAPKDGAARDDATGEHRPPDAKGAEKKGAEPPKPPKPPQAEWWRKVDLGDGDVREFGSEKDAYNHFKRLEGQARAWQSQAGKIEAKARALELAGGDPIKAAKILNPDFDFDQAAIQRVNELYQLEQMDPKDRAIQEREQKIAEYERKEQERQDAETKRQREETQKANRSRWQQKIADAVKEVAAVEGLAENVDFKFQSALPAVAGVLYHARQMNPEGDPALELTPQEVAREVLKQRRAEFDHGLQRAPAQRVIPVAMKHLVTLDGPKLLSTLGPEVTARIVKAHLDATNPSRAAPAASSIDPTADDPAGERQLDPEEERRDMLGLRAKKPPRIGIG